MERQTHKRSWFIWSILGLMLISIIAMTNQQRVASARQTTHEVDVLNNFFSPETITIAVGDSVKWTNLSGFHDVTSTSGPESFSNDTGFVWEFTHTFTIPGTYEYVCTIHFGMDGTVIVEEAGQATETPTPVPTSTATPEPSPTATEPSTPTAPTATPEATTVPELDQFSYLPFIQLIQGN